MMTVGVAQVAVEQTAYHFDKPFAYSIPEKLLGRVRPRLPRAGPLRRRQPHPPGHGPFGA